MPRFSFSSMRRIPFDTFGYMYTNPCKAGGEMGHFGQVSAQQIDQRAVCVQRNKLAKRAGSIA